MNISTKRAADGTVVPDIQDLTRALVLAQAEMENAAKNAVNPGFKSKYANLAEILGEVKPVLARYGLGVLQFPGRAPAVTLQGDGTEELAPTVITLETVIYHGQSGQFISSVAETPIAKEDPQGVGSAVTYLRRYTLAAAFAITQDDDDGNAASGRPAAQNQAPQGKTVTGKELRDAFAAAGDEVTFRLLERKLAKYPAELQVRVDAAKMEAAKRLGLT